MSYRNFIVILQHSIAIEFENGPYPLHSKSSQFSRTKRPYAGAAEYMDSASHCP